MCYGVLCVMLSVMENDKGGRGKGWNFVRQAGKGREGLCKEMLLDERHEGVKHTDITRNCAL